MGIGTVLFALQYVKPSEALAVKVDIDTAIKAANRILSECGAKDLQFADASLIKVQKTPCWFVGFRSSNSGKGPCFVQIDGRDPGAFYAMFGFGDDEIDKDTKGFTKDEAERYAWHIVKKFQRRSDLRLVRTNVGKRNAALDFELLLNGQPFFNSFPWYGYSLIVNPVSKRVSLFEMHDVIPPVVNLPEKVSKETAREKVMALAEASPQFEKQKESTSGLGPPYITLEDPASGYYKRSTEWMARKVWMVRAKVQRQNLNSVFTPSTFSWVVDRATGEAFPLLDGSGNRW